MPSVAKLVCSIHYNPLLSSALLTSVPDDFKHFAADLRAIGFQRNDSRSRRSFAADGGRNLLYYKHLCLLLYKPKHVQVHSDLLSTDPCHILRSVAVSTVPRLHRAIFRQAHWWLEVCNYFLESYNRFRYACSLDRSHLANLARHHYLHNQKPHDKEATGTSVGLFCRAARPDADSS